MEAILQSLASHAPVERQVPRTRVILAGTLLSPVGAVRVRVRDISAAGAKLWAHDPIPEGCDALFRLGHIFVAARVAWSRGREAGLSFYRELDSDELASSARAPMIGDPR